MNTNIERVWMSLHCVLPICFAVKLMIEGGYNPEPLDYFVKGDPVEVSEGPLKGLIGEVIRLDNNDRLLVRIDAIQHSVSIQINRGFLKPIKIN